MAVSWNLEVVGMKCWGLQGEMECIKSSCCMQRVVSESGCQWYLVEVCALKQMGGDCTCGDRHG